MAQTAYNNKMTITNSWMLVSEVDCTVTNAGGVMLEFIGAASLPTEATGGVPLPQFTGFKASDAILDEFTGASSPNLYMRARGASNGVAFVSREAVA